MLLLRGCLDLFTYCTTNCFYRIVLIRHYPQCYSKRERVFSSMSYSIEFVYAHTLTYTVHRIEHPQH